MHLGRGCLALLGAGRGTVLPASKGTHRRGCRVADRNASAFAKDTTSFSAGCIAPNSPRPTPEQPSEY